jgi:hypothetical protein
MKLQVATTHRNQQEDDGGTRGLAQRDEELDWQRQDSPEAPSQSTLSDPNHTNDQNRPQLPLSLGEPRNAE